ncbi:preQ(0) biosynthesis protein QueC [Clostridium amylolyticum]|uniref:7-cyano-7-deazaguanine synthase n=1 Tax=Clostridium amylolyticum TaxID=1121298 RepID=A0A1M6KDC3_9CLOT|nr:7-cyano-7-deazaguanine synthase [Clostridium amylolyticum]SHJ56949.1 preQ(0) biosynthesis protein QueC [Clostridium amylolyticum]
MYNNKVVLLFSGGIDSTVLLFYLIRKKYDIFPLYINYGQTSYEGEIAAIEKIIEGLINNKLMIINIQDVSKIGCGSLVGEYPNDVTSREDWYKDEFFPNRNLILLSLAAAYAYKINATNIAIGVVGDSYSDTSKEFLDEMKKTLEISLGKYNIIAPYANMDRKKVIEDAIRYNVPIELTFSCNSVGNRHCMLCTSCLDRENALLLKKLAIQ